MQCNVRPVFCALVALAFVLTGQAAAARSRYNATYFANETVIDQDGREFRFFDDLIKGKAVVINFVYLNCNDLCPLTTSRIAELKDRLGDIVGERVFFYTITMDPERDRAENLKAYADAFQSGVGWHFLTGDPNIVNQLRWKLGERSRKFAEHRNDLVLGNDITGEWSRISAYSDIEILQRTVLELIGLEPDHPENAAATEKSKRGFGSLDRYRLDRSKGEALYVKACSTCHTIGNGDLVGPDLRDIAERREAKWLRDFLMDPDGMRSRGDPLALEISQKYPGVTMPDLSLNPPDVDDILDYIAKRSKASAAAVAPDAAAGPSGASP